MSRRKGEPALTRRALMAGIGAAFAGQAMAAVVNRPRGLMPGLMRPVVGAGPGVPILAPGPSWNGTAGSGFGGSPPVRTGLDTAYQLWQAHMGSPTVAGTTGGTLAPAGQFVFTSDFLPDGPLSDDVYLGIDTEAYNDNVTVKLNFEGTELVLAPSARQRVTVDRYDDKTRMRLHVAKLSRAAFTTGAAEVYATISCAPLADRVIGPVRLHLRTAPDRVISVGTGQATVAGVSYPTLQAALAYASANSADAWIRINFVTDMVVDGAASWGTTASASNSRRGIIEINSNGRSVTAMRSTKGLFRPGVNATVWRGIKFDMTNIESVYHETATGVTANYRPMWIIGGEMGTSDRNELFRDGAPRNTSPTRYGVGVIGCYIHDINSGDWVSFYRFANKVMRKSGDIFHIQGWGGPGSDGGTSYCKANKSIDCTSEGLRGGLDALRATYSGAGTGTWEVGDDPDVAGTALHGGAGRKLFLKVDGAVTASFAISNTFGTGYFWVSELAAAISATANWTGVTLDNSRRASYLGSVEAGNTVCASGAVMKTHIFVHGDLVQVSRVNTHDGYLIVDNEFWDTEAQTFFTIGVDRVAYNSFYRRNMVFRPTGTVLANQWQIGLNFRHCGFDENTHPNQTLSLRYDGGLTFDEYSTIIGNIVEAVQELGTPSNLVVIRNNHAYGGGTLTGATGATSGGSSAADFPGIANPSYSRDDAVPALGSALRSYLSPPATRFDIGGVDRGTSAFPGAACDIEIADVILSPLSGTFVLPENAAAGAFAGVIYGKAPGAALSLIADAGGRVAIDGVRLRRGAAALDYETATAHAFTVRQALPDGRNLDTILSLGVTDIAEAMPLGYALVWGFDTVAGAVGASVTVSLDTSSRKALGTGAMKILGTAGSTSQAVSAIATTTEDMADWDVIAICVDAGQDYECNIGSVRPRFVSGGLNYDARTPPLVTSDTPFKNTSRGKRWVSHKVDNMRATNYSGASIRTVGTASKSLSLAINAMAAGNAADDMVVDALVRPDFHKPSIMLTFDDCNASQYTNAFPAMQARGIVGSMYGAMTLFDQSSRLTKAQAKEMVAAGWRMLVDSDDADRPMTGYATRTAAITALNANRNALIAEFGDIEGGKHLAYSYANIGYTTGPQTDTATGNGTTTITVVGTNAYSRYAVGMRVIGPSIPANSYVVAVPDFNKVTLNNVVPSGSSAVTFLARSFGIAATANGTATVTTADTTNLFAGQHMMGVGMTKDTRILSIDSATQFTTDKIVPSTVAKVNFGYVDGEWWPTKVHDDLLAAGYRSGRGTTGLAGMYTGFGIDPLAAIDAASYSLDSTSLTATYIAQLTYYIEQRMDVICYMHQVNDLTHFNAILDALVALRDAGKVDITTPPQWWANATARLPIA